ncbi:LysM peptidoglycan-binding domain-containing protein (plasmid) [Ensifer adhaerens]|uniref:LysM peptidoglycan-binding domain-containing protein n=1 Tax=Ensifer adhaerens TaxID=106592 RepID=UPI0021007165|nr:LysM peptidoglycan-binding domain-containing protein [Ensifer adhaerens]UTV41891.1 LysM peptidoglycan-binding domain-containing protein [Ensifer adhaerens]
MSYRIDIDGKNRYDASGRHGSAISDSMQRFFVEQINQAMRERAEAGGPKTIDPLREKAIVVEKGDSLWGIAKENHVSLEDLVLTNRIKLTDNTTIINANEVVIVPLASPKVVAQGPMDDKGVPKGEAAFINDLYDRGNKIAYADNPSGAEFSTEERAMQRDVGAYLHNLPNGERQAAALRLINSDWLDAGPAGDAVEAAIKETASTTPSPQPPAKHLSEAETLRQDLAARYLGGPGYRGETQRTPEEIYGVPTEKLPEKMADNNPLERAAYTSMYGGSDPVTGEIRRPLWEELGISRDELRQTMVERPWEITSHHMRRPVTEEQYNQLQAVDGPLGHLLNMGVDPETALSIQATWSAHFHGGYDPISQSQLKPVWERWGLESADQLTTLFEDSPAASIKLEELIGGVDPVTGKIEAAPWGDRSAEAYGAAQLRKAQDILNIQVLPTMKNVASKEDAELFALGFTTPSGTKQIEYVNPLQFAQSPSFRNGLQLRDGNIIVSNLMDPMGGVGLFGLVKGYPPQMVQNLDQRLVPGTNEKVKYQAHGLFQVFPENGEVVLLSKIQRLPKASGRPDPDSQFAKVMGRWSEAGGGVTFFVGKGDETEGSRGRTPKIAGVNWANAPDGTIERFGTALAAPFSPSERRAMGMQFQMGRNGNGEWVPSGLGAVTEWSTNRYQFWPMVTWDPNGGGLTGGSIFGGTGWTLGQFGLHYDPSRPTSRLGLLGGGSDGRSASVTYSDPSVFGIDLGGMHGKAGRAAGLGFTRGDGSNVAVSVDVVDGNVDAAERQAKSYHDRIARGEITPLDLPAGVRVTSTAQEATSFRAMGFAWLVNVGGGKGSGLNVTTEVGRTGENSWTVSRYDEPTSDWSWNAGIYGVGPGGHHWDAHMRGETLDITAPAGADGKPALQGEARGALDRYLTEGLLPGALAAESRFQGEAAENYRNVREGFQTSGLVLSEAQATYDNNPTKETLKALDRAKTGYSDRRADLNDFLRDQLKPGDELMPGIRIASTSRRDSQGSRPSFVVPMEAKTITRGETRTEDNTYFSYELSRRPLFGDDYSNQHAGRTGENVDVFQLSSTGTVRSGGGHRSHWLPRETVEKLDNRSVYGPLWEASGRGETEIAGTVSVDFTDAQIVQLGRSLSEGPQGDALWQSMANRASGVFGDDFLERNPEYMDNHSNLLSLSRAADSAAEARDLKDTDSFFDRLTSNEDEGSRDRLAKKFAGVTSPEAFAALSNKEQEVFIEVVAKSASADHSPYEATALIAAIPSEDRRSDLFRHLVEGIAETNQPLADNVNHGRRPDDDRDLGPNDRGTDRVTYFDDPTMEFVRFLQQDVGDRGVRAMFLQQTGFRSALPSEIESRRGKPVHDLAREVSKKYTIEKTTSVPGGRSPRDYVALTHDEARDVVGIIAAVGEQQGSDGAWQFMKANGIDPAQVFLKLPQDKGHDQVLRQALIDVLRPGSLGEGKAMVALLEYQQGLA